MTASALAGGTTTAISGMAGVVVVGATVSETEAADGTVAVAISEMAVVAVSETVDWTVVVAISEMADWTVD